MKSSVCHLSSREVQFYIARAKQLRREFYAQLLRDILAALSGWLKKAAHALEHRPKPKDFCAP